MVRCNDQQIVHVVDDEASIRKAICTMLEGAGHRVETYARATDFLRTYQPSDAGCLVLDVRMPGMDGMELQQYLIRHKILLPIIILTGHGDVPMAVQAMERGAFTFLQKPADPAILLEKVAEALRQDAESRRRFSEVDEIKQRLQSLTARELQVSDLLIQGKSARAVGRALGTTESTVRVQRASILKKMQADSVVDLLRMHSLLKSQ